MRPPEIPPEMPVEMPVEIPAGRRLEGTLETPPSKSVTHRALLLSTLSDRVVHVERPLLAEDTEHLIGALRASGRTIERDGEALRSAPAAWAPPAGPVEIDCGASGTLLRLLLGLLSARPGRWRLVGADQLGRRPIGPLVRALRRQGAEIDYLGARGFAPVAVRGGELAPGRARVDASRSSQFLSALILAGLGSAHGLEIEVAGLVSAPYVDLTLDWVRRFGGRVEVDGAIYRVEPGVRPPQRVVVEGDYSAAAYFAAGAALTAGDVRLLGLAARSAQGDRRFFELLERMGARVETRSGVVRVTGPDRLEAIDVDMRDLPDQVPTLAALAPFARGVTRIRGVPHLRLKESDRLAAMAAELARVGAGVRERAEGLEIAGVWADRPAPDDAVTVDSRGDHRVAMSMAVLGLRRGGVRIERPAVVRKSFPGFWDLFGRLIGETPQPEPGRAT